MRSTRRGYLVSMNPSTAGVRKAVDYNIVRHFTAHKDYYSSKTLNSVLSAKRELKIVQSN